MNISKLCLLISVSVLSLCVRLAEAQTAPRIDWQHCYGGTWSDGGTGGYDLNIPKEHMMIRTTDGGYAFVGETMSNDGDVSGNHVNAAPTQDFWLVKTDPLGKVQWQRCFGGTSAESPKCLIQTSDGGYAICGWTDSHDGDVIDSYADSVLVNLVTNAKSPPTIGWIAKVDSSGSKQWARNIGPLTIEHVEYLSLIEVPDGFIIAGNSNGADEDWHAHSQYTDTVLSILNRPLDALIMKLDRSGEHMWHRLLGGSGHEEATCILPCADGGYIFAGKAWSLDTDKLTGLLDDVRGIHATDPYHVRSDAWVVRLDSLCRILWQHCYGGTNQESATCIIKTPEGYMVAATAMSTNGDVTGNHGDQDAWIFTIDTNGKLLNQRCFGGDSTDVINSIIRLSDGNYAFAGTTVSTTGDVAGLHRGVQDSTDGWVGEFTPELNLLWQMCLGGTMNDNFGTVIETADAGLMVNGATISSNGDVVGLHPGKTETGKPAIKSDVWNVKLGNPNAGIEYSPVGAGFTNPYPNPSQDQVYLELFHGILVSSIHFYSSIGTEVFPGYHIEGTTAIVGTKNLPAGVYVIKVTYANSPVQIRKFVHEGF